jgi:aminopeptidase N
MPEIEANKAVLVGFKLGDLYADTFTYTHGEKAGQPGVSLKARLLQIRWAKVDGETVYSARTEATANGANKPSSEQSQRVTNAVPASR